MFGTSGVVESGLKAAERGYWAVKCVVIGSRAAKMEPPPQIVGEGPIVLCF